MKKKKEKEKGPPTFDFSKKNLKTLVPRRSHSSTWPEDE